MWSRSWGQLLLPKTFLLSCVISLCFSCHPGYFTAPTFTHKAITMMLCPPHPSPPFPPGAFGSPTWEWWHGSIAHISLHCVGLSLWRKSERIAFSCVQNHAEAAQTGGEGGPWAAFWSDNLLWCQRKCLRNEVKRLLYSATDSSAEDHCR